LNQRPKLALLADCFYINYALQMVGDHGGHESCFDHLSLWVARAWKLLYVMGKISRVSIIYNWGSSVSIVSDYRLDSWGSIPNRGRGFFL
jgi:hypothetical protein